MSEATVGVLLRKMIELEAQGAGQFFGEPEFDVKDMLHLTSDGRGVVTCLELADAQDKPRLFSTFMMWILAESLSQPARGGRPATSPSWCSSSTRHTCCSTMRPKAFLEQVEQVVRLIRSKGVGVYFVTQTPKDVPPDVLAQLSNRVQHALRAHTPDDDDASRGHSPNLSQGTVPRSRRDPHLARHRRSGGDRARPARRADPGDAHPTHPSSVPHGAAHAR